MPELEAVAELAGGIAKSIEAQLAFSRSRPPRSVEACDADLDSMLDDLAVLAKCVAEIALIQAAKES